MAPVAEINQGEIYVTLDKPMPGKVTLNQLGINEEDLLLKNGLLRLVIDMQGFREFPFYHVPTLEFSYAQETTETHWQCEFNGNTILDKLDHHGRSTVMLLARTVLKDFEKRHINKLIIHAEFPEPVQLLGNQSFVHLFR